MVADLRRWALLGGLLLAALAAGCDEGGDAANGAPCLRNDDCSSNRCIANTCRPMPQFQPPTGQGGSGGSN